VKLVNLWDKIQSLLAGDDANKNTDTPQSVPLRGYTENLQYIQTRFENAADFILREFRIGTDGRKAVVCFIEHLADRTLVSEQVIYPLTSISSISNESALKSKPNHSKELLSSAELEELTDLVQAVNAVINGHAVVIIEGYSKAISVNVNAGIGRQVTTAEIETTVLGPKAAFVELMPTNMALIRQRVRSSELKVEKFVFGTKTQTSAHLLYIAGVAPDNVVQAMRERLQNLNIDELHDVAQLSELIEVSPYSPLPQTLMTERPDKVSANLLEGRVALFVDGSAEALVLPAAFSDLFQSSDDYYMRSLPALFVRLMRIIGFIVATTLPSFYVGLVSYNYEVLPTDLTVTVAEARAGIPFPPVVEALLMLVLVDILQEGTTRLPSKIGQTVGVVGGFVLGQAVIQARLVSPLMIIVAAVSVIGSFAAPDYHLFDLIRFTRYILLFGAGVLSGVGAVAVLILLLCHMCSIEILGVPYLRPVAPLRLGSFSDFIFRRPARQGSTLRSRRFSGRSQQ